VSRIERALDIADVREAARRRMPRSVFDVIEGGHGDETTLSANRADLDAIKLFPRSLVDTTTVGLETTVLGRRLALPFLLGPCSFGRMCDPEGEVAVARAATAAGVGYVVPGAPSRTIEEVSAASADPLWYQIYLRPDPAANVDMLDRITAAGYSTLVVSVDTPMKPYRARDLRNGFSLPLKMSPRLMLAAASKPRWAVDFAVGNGRSGFSIASARRSVYSFEDAMRVMRPVTLEDIAWLRERWSGPLVVKGILQPDRIDELVELGVDGVVVSNHGGRNLDGVSSTITALPPIVAAAGGRLSVMLDSGIRRGADVVRALAMGADAAFVGRPYMYGLAAGGEAGVARVIELLRGELVVALRFLGCTSIADIGPDLLGDGPVARDTRFEVRRAIEHARTGEIE
jgi:isopentenyl diphosphate isomerase/L-lactate dehydrogenase-like FMN-dependent dehydrogenase